MACRPNTEATAEGKTEKFPPRQKKLPQTQRAYNRPPPLDADEGRKKSRILQTPLSVC